MVSASSPPGIVTTNPVAVSSKNGGGAAKKDASAGLLLSLLALLPNFNWLAVDLLNKYEPGKPHEDTVLNSLTAVYNTIALITALLLAVGITPMLALKDWYAQSGETPAFIVMAVSQLGCMGTCFFNLLIILGCLTYLNGVKSEHAEDIITEFPVFGLPFLYFGWEVIQALIFSSAWMYAYLPLWYTAFFTSLMVLFLLFFGLSAGYCFRHRARQAQLHDKKERLSSHNLHG
jgi:hypothetical protein